MDYLYFIYGLAFVLLTAICLLLRQDDARGLPWANLGLFGLLHGAYEWMEMLAIPLGDRPAFAVARVAVLMLSFYFLLEFGRQGRLAIGRTSPTLWIYAPLLVAALAGGLTGLPGLNASIRYAFGLPGAVWAGWVLICHSRGKGIAAAGLILAAVAMALYAVAAGVFVPSAPFFPASFLNAESFLATTGTPIQLTRTVLAVLISTSLWAHYLQRHRDTLDDGESHETYHGVQMSCSLVVVLVVGWLVTRLVGGHADTDIRNSMRTHAMIAAAMLEGESLESFTEPDPEVRFAARSRLEQRLTQVLAASSQIRWVHLLIRDPVSNSVTVVASAPETGPGRDAPQGAIDSEQRRQVREAFLGRALLAGPYTDDTGTYLSGFAPVLEPGGNGVVAVVALDMDAGQWRKDVAEFRLATIAVTLFSSVLIIGLFVLRRRSWELTSRIVASETMLAEAEEVAHVGSWSYNPTSDRMTWSREMFRILGYERGTTEPSYKEHQQRIAPEDREALDSAIRGAYRNGAGYELEVRLVWPDGTIRHVVSKAGARRGDGKASGRLVGTMEDVTDRKAAEEELKQERNLLRTLIDELPDFIYVKDRKSRFLVANIAVARLMGAGSPDELIGKTDADFYPGSVADEYLQDERVMFMSGLPILNKDEPHVDPVGTRRDVLTTKVPMRDSNGRIVGFVGISRDVTERKRAMEEIKQLNATLEQRVQRRTAALTAANEELETFTYSVSHDLRAPLRHMIGFLNLLKESLRGRLEPKAAEYLADVEHASVRMATLIDDLLSFSRVGRAEMHKQRVDLRDILKEVLAELEPDAAGRRIDWKIGELLPVHGDAAMIRQVFVNLLDNALKFTSTRETAEIEVGCRLEGAECVVSVHDNGVGFDAANAGKMFGVFQRFHADARFSGSGIGLANVRRIVQRHGGRTWAEGAVGVGATFYFSLPSWPEVADAKTGNGGARP